MRESWALRLLTCSKTFENLIEDSLRTSGELPDKDTTITTAVLCVAHTLSLELADIGPDRYDYGE